MYGPTGIVDILPFQKVYHVESLTPDLSRKARVRICIWNAPSHCLLAVRVVMVA